jgi:hypothetical protein
MLFSHIYIDQILGKEVHAEDKEEIFKFEIKTKNHQIVLD